MRDFYELQQTDPQQYIRIVGRLMEEYLGNIIIFDHQDRVMFISNSTCHDLGCAKEEVLGQHKSVLIALGYTERSASDISRRSKRQEQISVKALKTNEVMFASTCPIMDDEGNIVFIVNRSETEKDLLNKMDTIYTERFLLESHFRRGRISEQGSSLIVAKSPATQQVFALADEIAQTDSAVMLNGEPGVGKEVLASYIHHHSRRSGRPFISVNCSAIPSELMESEFFGYEKGSFTGAERGGKPGLFEMANTGTLFLDEIGEMPISLQPKLLRVLDSGEFRRIGGQTALHSDARIIAATNRDLRSMVEQGLFRQDLFYRLNIIPIHIPPLRERREDICELANQFLNAYNRKYDTRKKLAIQTQNYLMEYHWPGNVRELKNMIERLATISKSDVIFLKAPIGDEDAMASTALPEEPGSSLADPGQKRPIEPLEAAVLNFERAYIKEAIDQNEGNVSKAARQLGIHRSVIYRKLKDQL